MRQYNRALPLYESALEIRKSELGDKVFTGAMGLLGDAGGLTVLNQKKDQEAEEK